MAASERLGHRGIPIDPDVTLEQIRAIVARKDADAVRPGDDAELVGLVGDLDDWMSAGGFLPLPWAQSRR